MLAELLPPAFGGAARQALQLAARLRDRNVDVFFLSLQIVPNSSREDQLNGFRVFRIPYMTSGKWIKLRGLVAAWNILWKQRHAFDLLHLHSANYFSLAIAGFVRFILRKPFIIKKTSIDRDVPTAIRRNKYSSWTWWMFQRATAWVAMSHAQADDCHRHQLPEHHIHIIPNGVDIRRFRPAATPQERTDLLNKLGLNADRQHAVFIGSIEENKGIRLLVETARLLRETHPNLRFVLVGPNGSDPGEWHISPSFIHNIRRLINEYNLNDHVQMVGQKNNPEEYLRAADLFVFPSRSEGFGTALIEAMASGLPTVAFNIPGVTSDIITDNTDGLLISQEDPAVFAQAIQRILNNQKWKQQISLAARSSAEKKFSFDSIADRYRQLYQTVLSSS
jgi:glycosyltransferase involved in cell wall biosynthesis